MPSSSTAGRSSSSSGLVRCDDPHAHGRTLSCVPVAACLDPEVSYEATAAVWAYSLNNPGSMSGSDLLVLLNLADHMNKETRRIFPAKDTIAAECQMSVRTVSRSIEVLKALGVVVQETHHRGRVNHYRIMLPIGQIDRYKRTPTDKLAVDNGHSVNGQRSDWPTNQEETKKEPAEWVPSSTTTWLQGSGAIRRPLQSVATQEDVIRAREAARALFESYRAKRNPAQREEASA